MSLYNAISPPQGQSQCALQHIITGTDLITTEPTSTPRGANKRAAVLALQLKQLTILMLSLHSVPILKTAG